MIMFVQNEIFTAEAPRAQRKFFQWREMPPNKKVSVVSRQASSLGVIASKRFLSSSLRPAYRQGVFLIQSSSSDWIKRKPFSATSAALR
jgi:hypothetical protein